MKHPIRHIARIKVECTTPLAIGSGQSGLENERLIVRDANGLPFIPGTSLAGVIRHEMKNKISEESLQTLFGFQEWSEAQKKNIGQGSRVLFSPGTLLYKDNETVLEGIQKLDDPFISIYQNLPERDHVRINDRGVAEEYAKFREQLVIKGSRFVFEMEFWEDGTESACFQDLMNVIQHPAFRIGAGTRNGFGELKVVEIRHRTLDLTKKEDLLVYLGKSSSLNADFPGEKIALNTSTSLGDKWIKYQVEIKPHSYFLFGSGDLEYERSREIIEENGEKKTKTSIKWWRSSPKKEVSLDWSDGTATLKEEDKEAFLIPGTSIKGALSHRTAFHYNQLAHEAEEEGHTIESAGTSLSDEDEVAFDLDQALEAFSLNVPFEEMNYPPDSPEWKRLEDVIDKMSIEDSEAWMDYEEKMKDKINGRPTKQKLPVGENNPAVQALFGYAKDSDKEDGQRGRVIIPDIFLDADKVEEKVFSHVAIDRFTGGAIDGALFEERVIEFKEAKTINIFVETSAFDGDKRVKTAFTKALDDLVNGHLALGGNTTKGHGIFTGAYSLIED
jgi:CRISPR/Cas system CSM-associated protein Csm3 (group 7 of RAMP superfamily)